MQELKQKAKDFVSKIASGTPKEMDYYADILTEFAKEETKELRERLNNQAISIGSYQEDLKKAEELLEAFLSFKNTTNDSREALEIMDVRKRAKELVERIRNL